MQKSLFHAQNNSDKSVVTGGDTYIGKTYGKLPHEEISRDACHHLSPCHHNQNDDRHAGAVILVADLERRGVSLRTENGIIVCIGDSAVIDRFSLRIVEHKRALIELLTPSSRAATGAEINVVEYVRTRGAGYFAQQRANTGIARCWSEADRAELARLCILLDAGKEIE